MLFLWGEMCNNNSGIGSIYQDQHKCIDGNGKHKRTGLNSLIAGEKIKFKQFKT